MACMDGLPQRRVYRERGDPRQIEQVALLPTPVNRCSQGELCLARIGVRPDSRFDASQSSYKF